MCSSCLGTSWGGGWGANDTGESADHSHGEEEEEEESMSQILFHAVK